MLRRVLAADVFPFSHQRDGESYYELNPGARGNHLADDSFDPPSSYEKRRRGDDSDSDTSTSIRKGVRRGTSHVDDYMPDACGWKRCDGFVVATNTCEGTAAAAAVALEPAEYRICYDAILGIWHLKGVADDNDSDISIVDQRLACAELHFDHRGPVGSDKNVGHNLEYSENNVALKEGNSVKDQHINAAGFTVTDLPNENSNKDIQDNTIIVDKDLERSETRNAIMKENVEMKTNDLLRATEEQSRVSDDERHNHREFEGQTTESNKGVNPEALKAFESMSKIAETDEVVANDITNSDNKFIADVALSEHPTSHETIKQVPIDEYLRGENEKNGAQQEYGGTIASAFIGMQENGQEQVRKTEKNVRECKKLSTIEDTDKKRGAQGTRQNELENDVNEHEMLCSTKWATRLSVLQSIAANIDFAKNKSNLNTSINIDGCVTEESMVVAPNTNEVIPRFKGGLSRVVRWHDPSSSTGENHCREFSIDDWRIFVRQRSDWQQWRGKLREALEDANESPEDYDSDSTSINGGNTLTKTLRFRGSNTMNSEGDYDNEVITHAREERKDRCDTTIDVETAKDAQHQERRRHAALSVHAAPMAVHERVQWVTLQENPVDAALLVARERADERNKFFDALDTKASLRCSRTRPSATASFDVKAVEAKGEVKADKYGHTFPAGAKEEQTHGEESKSVSKTEQLEDRTYKKDKQFRYWPRESLALPHPDGCDDILNSVIEDNNKDRGDEFEDFPNASWAQPKERQLAFQRRWTGAKS